MKEIDKLKETLDEIHKLAEESILYLPKMKSLDLEEKEPLIKDEKVRKAVRAWAEANDIEAGLYDADTFSIGSDDNFISFNNGFADETKIYTIAELCGEENEED